MEWSGTSFHPEWRAVTTPARLPPGALDKDLMPEGLIYLFIYLFRAAPMAYESSQARGRIRSAAANLQHSHSNSNSSSEPCLWPYATAQGNAGWVTYWAKPGMEPVSSWILVGFLTPWAMMGTHRGVFTGANLVSPLPTWHRPKAPASQKEDRHQHHMVHVKDLDSALLPSEDGGEPPQIQVPRGPQRAHLVNSLLKGSSRPMCSFFAAQLPTAFRRGPDPLQVLSESVQRLFPETLCLCLPFYPSSIPLLSFLCAFASAVPSAWNTLCFLLSWFSFLPPFSQAKLVTHPWGPQALWMASLAPFMPLNGHMCWVPQRQELVLSVPLEPEHQVWKRAGVSKYTEWINRWVNKWKMNTKLRRLF